MLLIKLQSIKSKLDALLLHITLNDIHMHFIAETYINTDHDDMFQSTNIRCSVM